MKNKNLMDYHCGKATRAVQSLALLITLLLLLTGCGGSSATNSSQAPSSALASTPTSRASASTPTSQASAGITSSNLTFSQAQQQAGYHLLSIPSSLVGYTLTKVTEVDSSGHRVYDLLYTMSKKNILITEGQPLENQAGSSKVSLRGTTGMLFAGNGFIALYWTENGVSRGIIGPLSNDQVIALAKALV